MEINGIAGIVTGAASGLGRATANLLAQSGARLLLLDLDGEGLEKVVKEFEGKHLCVSTNVADYSSVQNAITKGIQQFGEFRFAINCAGIPTSALTVSRGVAHDLEIWQRVIDVNLTGTFNVLRFAAEHMSQLKADEDGQRGVIVNTSSVAAFDGQRGQAAYAASKAAIAGMCLPVARDLAEYGIRCMAIAPGLFQTELLDNVPQKGIEALSRSLLCPNRMGAPTEFAKLVETILTNSYMNGTCYRLDGGSRLGK